MHTDPIADMLTRIRNALAIASPSVVREGYLKSAELIEGSKPLLRIGLKYGPKRSSVIHELTRVSTPGRRSYAKANGVPVIRGGLGLAIVSTSQGLMVDREARRRNIGGEVICEVW
jgi:small subunit ribosomal protein S8